MSLNTKMTGDGMAVSRPDETNGGNGDADQRAHEEPSGDANTCRDEIGRQRGQTIPGGWGTVKRKRRCRRRLDGSWREVGATSLVLRLATAGCFLEILHFNFKKMNCYHG